jgi:hypothetical protein
MDMNTQATMKYNAWVLAQTLKGQTRSNSWSDSLDDFRINEISRSILGDSNRTFYDALKRSYGDILYSFNLLSARAQILKFLSTPPPQSSTVEFVAECTQCKRITKGPFCVHCKKFLINCGFCTLPIRGSSNSCLGCGHSFHTYHVLEWFNKHDKCPVPLCGCYCTENFSVT